jgi:hypothetical protein
MISFSSRRTTDQTGNCDADTELARSFDDVDACETNCSIDLPFDARRVSAVLRRDAQPQNPADGGAGPMNHFALPVLAQHVRFDAEGTATRAFSRCVRNRRLSIKVPC